MKKVLKNKKILLVEGNYKTDFKPLGLMRISTWHKNKGDSVEFIKGERKPNYIPDKIYITTLFTYKKRETLRCVRYYRKNFPNTDIIVGGIMASLHPEIFKKEGVRVHVGLLKCVEDCPPDYELFPKMGYSLTFSSRGCTNKCQFCLPENEEIFTGRGFKKIKGIPKRNGVFIDKKYKILNESERDYNGKIYTIKAHKFNLPIKVTANHKIPIVRKNREIEIEAKDIIKGDYLKIPIIKTKDSDIDKKFLKLAGYYLSEGSVHKHKNRPGSYQLSFTFNDNEKNYINEVKSLIKELFGVDAYITKTNTATQISTGRKKVAKIFYNFFGKGARRKYIYDQVLLLPEDKLYELLKGYYYGDGSFFKSKDGIIQIKCSSVSKSLAYSIFLILIKLGYNPYLNKRKQSDMIQGRKVNVAKWAYEVNISKKEDVNKLAKKIYNKKLTLINNHPSEKYSNEDKEKFIKLCDKNKNITKTAKECKIPFQQYYNWKEKIKNPNLKDKTKNGFAIFKIKEIKSEKFKGKVYNIEVDKIHKYLCNGILVNNCVVPVLEGNLYSRTWINDVNLNFPKLYFFDNNWLAKPKEELFKDIELLHELKKKGVKEVDWNQSLDCYDNKTEVLTKEGWKPFKNVKSKDEIATLNQKTHELEYQKPIKIIKKKHDGEMVYIKNNSIDLCITPKHNLFIQYQYNSNERHKRYLKKFPDAKRPIWSNDRKPYHLEPTEEVIKKTNINFKKTSNWKGKKLKEFIIKGMNSRIEIIEKDVKNGFCKCGCGEKLNRLYSCGKRRYYIKGHNSHRYYRSSKDILIKDINLFLEFMGWFLSEGYTSSTGKSKESGIVGIVQHQKDNLKEIHQICKSLGFKPKLYKDRVSIHDKTLFNYLKQFGKAKDKFVPQFIKELPPKQIRLFIETYTKGDGSFMSTNGYKPNIIIASISKRMIDDLQELSLKAGWCGNTAIKTKKGTEFFCPRNNKTYKYNGDLWHIKIRCSKKGTRIYNNFYYKFYDKSDVSLKEINLFKSKYYKDIFKLKHIENKQIKEIAKILNVTNKSVTKNLYLINKKLKKNGFKPNVIREKKKTSYSEKDYDIIKKNYKGYVYCVTVPNEVIYVRRNGKAVWCGNCRLFSEEVAKKMKGLNVNPMRFSFDHMGQDKHCQKAMELSKKYGFAKIHVDVLYNWNDTIEDFYYRLKEVCRLGGSAILMRYAPIDETNRDYVGRHWTKNERDGVNRLNPYPYGQVSSKCQEEFELFFGKDAKEFKRLLNFKDIKKLTNLKFQKFNKDKIWKKK